MSPQGTEMGWELEPSKAKDHSQVRGTERGRRHLRHRWSWEEQGQGGVPMGGVPMLCSSHLRPGKLLKPGEPFLSLFLPPLLFPHSVVAQFS